MVAVDADVNVFASGTIGQHGGDERWLVDEAAGASSVASQGNGPRPVHLLLEQRCNIPFRS